MALFYTGVALNIIGCLFMCLFLGVYVQSRLQNKKKMLMLVILIVISMTASALVVICRKNEKCVVILGSISMVFPAMFLLFLGGFLIIMASSQGMNAIQLPLFFIVISSLLAFVGSIMILLK